MSEVVSNKERYKSLDGLRAIAAVGIVCMHVQANSAYHLRGFVAEKLIPSFTNFTYLFMIISAFSLCCGYYEKFQNGSISLKKFYLRRYQRIWPFFAILCTAELILQPSKEALYQYIADLTLAFGFIPNNHIDVVGVGWFLGTVFVFYMIFPFFCFLISEKKRAWFSFGVTVVLHILIDVYFTGAKGRENFIFSSMFFLAGGLIYIYRDELKEKYWISVITLVASIFIYYLVNGADYVSVIVFSMLTVCCLKKFIGGVLQTKPLIWLSRISMEIYLSHMFAFRILEKLHFTNFFGDSWGSYLTTVAGTIIGAIIISMVLDKIIDLLKKRIGRTA